MWTALLVIILMIVVFAVGVVLGLAWLIESLVQLSVKSIVSGETDRSLVSVMDGFAKLVKQRAYKKYAVDIESIDVEVNPKIVSDSL